MFEREQRAWRQALRSVKDCGWLGEARRRLVATGLTLAVSSL